MSKLAELDRASVILEADAKDYVTCECGCGERVLRAECVKVASGVTYQALYTVLHRPCAIAAWGVSAYGFTPLSDPFIPTIPPAGNPHDEQQRQQRPLSPYAG